MHRLRKHQRVDRIKTEVRATKGSYGKWIYLGLLMFLALWLLDLFVGRYFYFQANGMVMRDIHTLSLSYPAQIRKQHVREGDYTNHGDLLLEVISMQIIEQLTTLTIKIADIDAKIRADQAQLNVISATIKLAKKRADDMKVLRAKQEGAISRGLTNTQNMSQLLQDEFDSQIKYKQMSSESTSLKIGLNQLLMTRDKLKAIHEQTQNLYQEGKVYAQKSGIIANVLSYEGSVITPGDKVFDILHGGTYILAYLDPDTLYHVDQGDEVSVQFGFSIIEGVVQQIFPLSTELPKEFQRTFRPLERSTVMLINIDNSENVPPIYTTVEVYSSGILVRWFKGGGRVL